MNPKLSIITVNKNNENGLKKTINSVIFQTFSDFEFIIIDGASYDNSVNIITEHENYIDYWISEDDSGIFNAMNKGIKVAKGEYCLFLNSGDILYHDKALEEVFDHNPQEDIVCGNAIFLKSSIHKERIIIPPENLKASDLILRQLPHQSSFIKKNLFYDIHLYDENFSIVSDGVFFLEALLVYKKSYSKINVMVSACDSEGVSNQHQNVAIMEKENIKAFKKIIPELWEDYVELGRHRSKEGSDNSRFLKKIQESIFFRLLIRFRKLLLRIKFFYLKNKLKEKILFCTVRREDNAIKKIIANKINELELPSLSRSNTSEDIIVSLTSHGKRVSNSTPYAIYSLFNQSVLPNRIVLFLDATEWNDDNIPSLLKKLQQTGLEIVYCKDVGPQTKLLPALLKFPDNPIITIDDDIYYNENLVADLLEEYNLNNQKKIICNRAKVVTFRNSLLIPYSSWLDNTFGSRYSMLSPMGVGGVIYPPHIFSQEIFNEKIFLELCPTSDDIWFWLNEFRDNIMVTCTNAYHTEQNKNIDNCEQWIPNDSALYFKNYFKGGDDKHLKQLTDFYNIRLT